MADYNKSIDLDRGLNKILDRLDEHAKKIQERSEDAGRAVGDGFERGANASSKKIQASEIKLHASFKKLQDKIQKKTQQLSASLYGKPVKLSIDFSDVDINSKELKRRVDRIVEQFNDDELVVYKNDSDKQSFRDLISLTVKYDEKLSILRKSLNDLKTPDAVLKNLQQQYVVAQQISNIYSFLSDQAGRMLPKRMPDTAMWSYELQSTIKMLSNFTDGSQSAVSQLDFSPIAEQLGEIKQAINDVRDAFKPLTDAFANEDSAIGKMVRSNIEDLNALQNKFEEVFKNIETLSHKEFSNTTVYSQQSAAQDVNIAQLNAYKERATETLRIIKQFNQELMASDHYSKTLYPGGRPSDYANLMVGFKGSKSGFNDVDLAKQIAGADTLSAIRKVVGALDLYKAAVMEAVGIVNSIEPNHINTSILSVLDKLDQKIVTAGKVSPSDATDNTRDDDVSVEVNTDDALSQLKQLGDSLDVELSTIRSKIEETFNFATVEFNTEHITSIVDNIYQQFVELQSKINALDLKIAMPSVSTGSEVVAADDAIKREGEEADKASVKKDAFTAANKRVAESGSKTAAGVQEATDEIVEEGEAAGRAADKIQEAYGKIQKSIGGNGVTVNGTTYEDFQNFAMTLASSNNMKIDDVSVVADSNDDVKLATIKMVNEELAQSVTYTYRLKDAEEGVAQAYLERYKASSNVNKALKMQLAAQKKADADKAKADKEKAQNNQWLIRQQGQLDTQIRRYQNSSKKISGATPLTSVDSSLADDADKTIDSLVQHIRDRIQSTSGEMLTDELREQILNDLRILKHEIGIEQSNQYSSTNMKASTVETNKKAYKQYLEAFKARASKDGVFDRMTEVIDGQEINMISQLESMLADVADADSLNAFIDQLKVARNKMQAEKAKLANEQQEQKQRMADEEAMWSEHNKSKEESAKREQEINRAYAERAQQEAEEERKLAEQSRKEIEAYYEARDKQLKSYGKTEYNREKKFNGKLDGYLSDIDGDEGQQLKNLVEQYRTAYQTIESLRNQFESDPASAEDVGLKTEFQQSVIHAERLRKEIVGIFNESQKIKQSWQTSGIGQAGLLGEFNTDDIRGSMVEYVNSLGMGTFTMTGFDETSKKMFGTLDQGNGIIKNITVALDGSEDAMYAWTTATSRASDEWDDFKAKMSGGVKQLVGTYFGFHEAIQAVRSGLNYVKEIDLAMTELKKVTDETDASYNEFLKDASSISAVIGSTISDFTNATATFARLGYSMEESSSMAETAIIYRNVADGLDSVEESSQSIISTMAAFGVESNNTMSIIDKFNAVGNSFSITSAGIGDALQRSASALYSAGNTIDESVALVTAANAVIQNPEQVGTALKTLSLRLRGAKTELEEAGEDVEGMAENTSELQAKLKALTHGKVDIMLDADTFKSTTQILREMSTAWEDMTDIERASALELMGGKRQSNILSSVITNFETVEDVIETSMNSSGSAIAENEKWLDSIEGKTYQFTNALQTMWSNMLDSEMIKGFIDFGTDVIQFLDTGTGKVIALVAAIKLMSKFKGFSISGIYKGIEGTVKNISQAQQTLQSLKLVMPGSDGLSTQQIQQYANVVSGLTPKYQAQMLAAQGLTNQQVQLAMQYNNVSEAAIREATAHIRSKATKEQEIVANQNLLAEQTRAMAATYRNNALTIQGADASKDAAAANLLEAAACNNLTKEELYELVVSSKLEDQTKQEIITKLRLAQANNTAADSAKGIAATAATIIKANPIGFAMTIISIVGMIVSAVDNAKQKIIDAAQEAEDAIESLNSKFQTDAKTVTDYAERFAELAQGVDMLTGKNLSLTTDDYAEFLDLSNQLADIFPTLSRNYDENGNAIVQLSGDTDTMVGSLKALLDVQRQITNQQILDNLPDLYSGVKNKSDAYDKKIDKLNKQLNEYKQLQNVLQNNKQFDKDSFFQNFDDLFSGGAVQLKGNINEIDDIFMAYEKVFGQYGLNLTIGDQLTHIDPDTFETVFDGYSILIDNTEYYTEQELESAKSKIAIGVSDLATAYANEINNLNTQIETAVNSNKANWGSLSSAIAAWLSTDSTYKILSDDMQSMIQQLVNNLDYTSLDFGSWEDAQEWIQTNIVQQLANAENKDAIQDAINNLLTVDTSKTSYQMYNELRSAVLTAIETLPAETQDAIKKALGLDMDSEYQTYFNHAQDILQDEFDDMVNGLTLSDLQIIDQLDIPPGTLLTWDDLKQKIQEAGSAYDKSIFSLSAYQEKIDSLNTSLDNIQGAYNTLSSVVKEYNSTGYLTLDTLQSLLELNPEYLTMLQMENGQLSINKNAAIQLVKAKLAEAEATTIDTAIQRLNALATKTAADATLDSGEAASTVVSSLGKYSDKISSVGQEAIVAAGKISAFNAAVEGAQSNKYVSEDDINRIIGDMNKQLTMINNLRNNISTKFGSIMKNNSSSSSSSSNNDFDFIDVYFTNLENNISEKAAELETIIDDASKLDIKKKISDEIIDYYSQQSEAAKKAADYYSNKAASVLSKIPSKYQNAIKNGTLDIATISDDSLNDLLTKYRDYVDKASDYTEKYWDSLEEVANKAKEQFGVVREDYENPIGLIKNANDQLDAQISLMEDRGYVASIEYYERMIANSTTLKTHLEEEKKSLQAVLDEQVKNGNVKVNSAQWYEMVQAINDVDAEIVGCISDIEGFNNSINDIKWDNFGQLTDRIDALHDETQNLIDLLENSGDLVDDQGEWTKEGIASLGLYAQQMEIAEYEAKQYAEAIQDLKNNQDKYSESEYAEKMEELVGAQYDSIEAYYDAQDAIVDLNKTRVDAIKQGIEKEIEAYEELINKKKEALDADKDIHDFQKSVMEQEKEIATIERKLAAIANDNSMSANAKRAQLEADLAEAKASLEETYYDRSISNQKDALDNQLDNFKEEKDAEIEKWEEWLEDIKQVVAESLGLVKDNASDIYDTLGQKADEYNLTLSDAIKTPWGEGMLAISDYQNTFDTAISSTMDQLELLKGSWQAVIDKMIEASKVQIGQQDANNANITSAKEETSASSQTSSSTTTSHTSSQSSNSYETYVIQKGDTLSKIAKKKLGSASRWKEIYELNKDIIKNPNKIYPKQKIKLPKYASGTLGTKSSQLAWIDELGEELVMHASGNGKLAFLSKGSAVVPHDITENLMELGKLDPSDVLSRNTPQIGVHPEIHNTEISVTMDIAEVVHIDSVTQDTIPDLTKAVKKQIDEYVKQMNRDIRKYTR